MNLYKTFLDCKSVSTDTRKNLHKIVYIFFCLKGPFDAALNLLVQLLKTAQNM
jgi:hypothetical protein